MVVALGPYCAGATVEIQVYPTMAVLRPNPVAQVASIAHAIWSVSAPLLVSADLSLPQVVDLRAEAIKISPGS